MAATAVLLGLLPAAVLAQDPAVTAATDGREDAFVFGPFVDTATAAGSQQAQAGAAQAGGDQYRGGVYAIDPNYLLGAVNNVWRIVTGPARYDNKDWLRVSLVVGAAGALLALDEQIIDYWQGNVRGGFTDDAADIIENFGDTQYIAIGALGTYVVAEVLGQRREKAAALLTFESPVLTAGLISGLKYVTGRERPANTDDALDFNGPSMGDFNASFPSGHAGNAFSTATVMSEIYGPEHPWVPFVAYPLATGVALARLNDDRHWASDVLVGGAIGFFVGEMVTRFNPFLDRADVSIRPLGQPGYDGAALAMRF